MTAVEPQVAPLAAEIAEEIRASGPMRFSRYMELCLYHPEHGYYAGGKSRVGRRGDFFTSVSVGPVFGQLLATYVFRQWNRADRPKPFRVIEQGANDGQLAADILEEIGRKFPALFESLTCSIIEPFERVERLQRQRLEAWDGHICWFRSSDDLAKNPQPGVLLANELLDAFPVDRFRFDGTCWRAWLVGLNEDHAARPAPAHGSRAPLFKWVAGPECANPTGNPLGRPPGYTTELCPSLGSWLASAAAPLASGTILIIDYGHEAAEFFAPHRTDGTLRGYRAHQRCDDPFLAPGETDLTADVNFSAVIEAAQALGFAPRTLETQERFLVRLAGDRLRELSGRPPAADASAWLRQFQTLTHPQFLGRPFKALELEK